MKHRTYILLFFAFWILASCKLVDLACEHLEGSPSSILSISQESNLECSPATGDNLCTKKCQEDFPTPEGKVLFGKVDKMTYRTLDCKCYAKKLRKVK